MWGGGGWCDWVVSCTQRCVCVDMTSGDYVSKCVWFYNDVTLDAVGNTPSSGELTEITASAL